VPVGGSTSHSQHSISEPMQRQPLALSRNEMAMLSDVLTVFRSQYQIADFPSFEFSTDS